jgi:hypothetical protein
MARVPPLTAVLLSRGERVPGHSTAGANGSSSSGSGAADYGALQIDEADSPAYSPAAVFVDLGPAGAQLDPEVAEKLAGARQLSAIAEVAELAARVGAACVAGDGSGGGNPGARGWRWVLPETASAADDRLEMPQLCLFYLGPSGRSCYTVAIVLYIYASLWAYAVLVAQTFSTALPLDADPEDAIYSYWLYLAGFGGVATFLATRDITGPVMTHLSVTFSYGRVLLVVLMASTLAHAVARALQLDDGFVGLDAADEAATAAGGDGSSGHHAHSGSSSSSSSDPASTPFVMPMPHGDDVFEPSAPAPLFAAAGLLAMIPTAAFAMLFHYSIPTLTAPAADKAHVGNALATTIYLVAASYLCICVPAALYFGADALPAVRAQRHTFCFHFFFLNTHTHTQQSRRSAIHKLCCLPAPFLVGHMAGLLVF